MDNFLFMVYSGIDNVAKHARFSKNAEAGVLLFAKGGALQCPILKPNMRNG
jgi:hypothetical protein